MKPRYWQLSYDITDPKRLRRVAKVALQHGERVQKSLYLCPLTPEQLELMYQQLTALICPPDRAMLRPICPKCRAATRHQGAGGHPERLEPFWIV